MKKIFLNYSAPEVNVYEVAAEGGYETSSMLENLGVESDELVY